MPNARSLLERIEKPDPGDRRQLGTDLESLKDSIRRHLQLLLNSVRGGSESAPGYGIPSFSDYFQGGVTERELERAIAVAIAAYEPRLREVKVRFQLEGSAELGPRAELGFDVMALVDTGDQARPAVFHSTVAPSGRVKVRSG